MTHFYNVRSIDENGAEVLEVRRTDYKTAELDIDLLKMLGKKCLPLEDKHESKTR